MDDVIITTDKTKLDLDLIHNFLSTQARWSLGIPKSVVQTAIENSMCFAAFINGQQVGFARMVTDYATFGNVVDVFVLENFRGQGISGQLLTAINDHPDLQGLRRVMLATSDKQAMYAKFGFNPLNRPEIFMEKFDPLVYS